MSLYTCITSQHNGWLIALAASICGLGALSTFSLGREVLHTPDRLHRGAWAAAAVVATASAIWATHFIAMVAYAPGLPFRFAALGTVLSYAIALSLVGAGAVLILIRPGLRGRLLGGAVVGLAISAMHYVGMNAMEIQGDIHWDRGTVAVSVLSGVILTMVAAALPLSRAASLRILGPLALLLAVCSTHFVGMQAMTLAYDPRAVEPNGAVNTSILTVLVANVTVVILGLSLAALWLQGRERRQAIAERGSLQNLADIAVEGLLICDGPRIMGLNHSLAFMIGQGVDEVVGQPVARLLPEMIEPHAGDGRECDSVLRTTSGETIPVRIVSKRIAFGGQTQTVLAVRDQRGRLKVEADLWRLARVDTLTGLANRLSFGETVTARCASRRRTDGTFALLMLDLDRFKTVNDTLGHAMGDEVLRRVAGRLLGTVREGDLVSRLGGDEFAVVLDHADGSAELVEVAERMIEVIARPFIIDGHVLDLGASMGIAMAPADGDTLEILSRQADLALYRAKHEGRGTYRFFEAAMDEQVQERRATELDLRRATAHQEFEVVYQPQVDTATGAFTGAEALVRWNHPLRGTVSPADFIPLAEELGLIGAIGQQVLRVACAEAATWPDHLSVAVNVSPVQLRDRNFAATVADVLAETDFQGHRLELEITENALLHDDGQTLAILHALRRLGIRISMDDFGTGYSSLSYLRRFPFDKIKIDQSFVRQLPGDSDSAAIVQAIASLGSKLGMTVTAEGVETDAQRRFVTAEGCHQLQGYLFSKPVAAARVAELFTRADARPAAA